MSRSDHKCTAPGKVELQLMRPGPAHNQLLSPLTEYLALCGDHMNTTLRIPLEHEALLTRLRALRYCDSEATRIDQLRETARIASDLLAAVPGLIADLACDHCGGKPLVHFSIASRASELALFPFELATAPIGFPGAGQPLCLQTQLPICLTRRSRNVRNDDFEWNQPIKILFVASEAGGPVPLDQHYALLRKLVEPWVATMWDDEATANDAARENRNEERFLKDLRLALESDSFTHVHILAHGCMLPRQKQNLDIGFQQPRFGIAFFHSQHTPDRIDAVDGKRLAEALGYGSENKLNRRPAVVLLATCDSGNQGSVVVEGASVAFELHDAGIPLVVSSQFPLSFAGSIVMTESLYSGFLDGDDPRSTVWKTRRALHFGLAETMNSAGEAISRAAHDWASLTVYAALPEDIDRVLPLHRRDRERKRMTVHLDNVDRMLDDLAKDDSESWSLKSGKDLEFVAKWWRNFRKELGQANDAVGRFSKWVDSLESGIRTDNVLTMGIRASAQKRIGLLNLVAYKQWDSYSADVQKSLEDKIDARFSKDAKGWDPTGRRLIHDSRRSYWQIFTQSRNASWALVQFLSLDFALRAEFDNELWIIANRLTLLEKNSLNANQKAWSLGSLIELRLLGIASSIRPEEEPELRREALDFSRELRDTYPRPTWDVYSARRQLYRYSQNFFALAELVASWKSPQPLRMNTAAAHQVAEQVLRILSELDYHEFEAE